MLGVAVGVVDFGQIGSDLQGSHFDLDLPFVTLENYWLLQEGGCSFKCLNTRYPMVALLLVVGGFGEEISISGGI